MRMQKRILRASAVIVLCLAAASSAQAQRGEGAVRVGLGIPLLSVTVVPDSDATIVNYGLSQVTFGMEGHYQLSDEMSIGTQLILGGTTSDFGPFGGDNFVFAIMPRFEYMFMPTEVVSPYLGVEIGYWMQGDPSADLLDVFRAGAFAGGHLFPVDAFSFDGELALTFVHLPDFGNAGFQITIYFKVSGWIGMGGSSSGSGGGGDGGGEAAGDAGDL